MENQLIDAECDMCQYITNIDWDNGLLPVWDRAIIRTNANLLLIGPFIKKKKNETILIEEKWRI